MLVSSFNLSQSFDYMPYLFYKIRFKSEINSFCIWTRCCGSAPLWCGSGSVFSVQCRSGSDFSLRCTSISGCVIMQTRIRLCFHVDPYPVFMRIRFLSDPALFFCGPGSGFDFVGIRILLKVMPICNTGLQTLHSFKVSLHFSQNYSDPVPQHWSTEV